MNPPLVFGLRGTRRGRQTGRLAALRAADAGRGAVCAAFRWGSVPGWKLIGDLGEIDLGDLGAGGAPPECAEEAFEALRVEAGVPAGNEFQEGMIPAESGVVAEAVSFTKGCFVVQELTARIDSRGGSTPRHLRGVVIIAEADQPPPPRAALVLPDGGEVGELTSVSYSPALGGSAALAYVKRKVAPPARVEVRFEGESLAAEVRALPLVP